MSLQPWIMDVLADEFRGSKGFRVDAYPGALKRGARNSYGVYLPFTPTHVMDHHTGGGSYNALLRYMAEGPVHPPLCNYATSRVQNGIVRITLVAAGRANHSGRGDYPTIPKNQGNRYSIGAEHQNTGNQRWEDQHIEAMRRCDAALLWAMGQGTRYMLDHKTYAPSRKSDRYALDIKRERIEVGRILVPQPKPTIPPPPPAPIDPWEKFMSELTDAEKAILKSFAARAVEIERDTGEATSGRGLVNAILTDHRARREAGFDSRFYAALAGFCEGMEYMGTTPRTLGGALVALVREARARGWRISRDAFKDNAKYRFADDGTLERLSDEGEWVAE